MIVQTIMESNLICNQINKYLNYLDKDAWEKYTGISQWNMTNNSYEPMEAVKKREIRLALNICTYHRNEYVRNNVRQLLGSRFFDKKETEYYGKLHIFITDNGSELDAFDHEFVHLTYNSNTGGAGGFQKGLESIRASGISFTNVIFMDDDVSFLDESFYRLFGLLTYMKEEYWENVIAGRMFRKDKPWVQYTAAEIWNGGNLRHIGLEMDMSDAFFDEKLVNDCDGAEYSGWWFACFPASFCMKNDIIPFFIHCDDVEYGLRLGKEPIILNGIQVWHETYEYRQMKWMLYYDNRNSMIVNEKYNCLPCLQEVLEQWKQKITEYHVRQDWLSEYYVIKAMNDFLKGMSWLQKVNAERLHVRLVNTRSSRLKNAIAWRIVQWKLKRRKSSCEWHSTIFL